MEDRQAVQSSSTPDIPQSDRAVAARAEDIFRAQRLDVYRRTDRLFAFLLFVQWLAGILAAVLIAPRTWSGVIPQTHIHVYAAVFLGGMITALPVAMALFMPGAAITRHTIAIGQMLFSSLLIHLTGGRIETHFHVFGSLAFLAVYRDWRVLGTASLVVALDHLVRGIAWPQSVYGVIGGAEWRWLEHAGWVLFEDLFLIAAIQQSLVAMRSLAERQAMLEATNRAVEDAAEAKSAFLAHMSHEIRTPMTAILGYVDLMSLPSQRPAERAEALQIIRRNGEHLLCVLNDILDMSKIEAGRLRTERVDCNPAELVGEMASLMRPRAVEKGIGLKVLFRTPMPATIQTDPTRLRQILLNLLSNAIKFTSAGEVRVEVTLLRNTSQLRFDVIDTGIGMTSEQCRSLFEPFTQGDFSTTRRFGGTGLGLAISKRLSESLGGGIAVTSEQGKGSNFSITISTGPLERVEMIEMEGEVRQLRRTRAPGQSAPASEPAKLAGRVLLAEDSTDNRVLLKRLLERTGFNVEAVANGAEAVQRALRAMRDGNGDCFDLILMDMQMPEVDGYEATSQLRRHGYKSPIVAITAHASPTDRDKCLTAGCDSYLAKPYELDQLLECIRDQMGNAQAPVGRA
jgi:signal transduction histidine kinase/ActR/RegA family two-component response regulator